MDYIKKNLIDDEYFIIPLFNIQLNEFKYASSYKIDYSFKSKYSCETKTSFTCGRCKHSWNTIKSMYYVIFSKELQKWFLILIKQRCKQCERNASLYQIYDYLVEKVDKILDKVFSNMKSEKNHNPKEVHHSMTATHDAERCIACKKGLHTIIEEDGNEQNLKKIVYIEYDDYDYYD
jgi:hypothetical protein